MDNRKFACMSAAAFLGVTLAAGATNALAGPREVVVEGNRIAPELQRTVSYRDLNLAQRPDQKVLKGRIRYTANDLCFDLNGWKDNSCYTFAIKSTRSQVAAAIDRAERKLAGYPVGPPIAISMVIGIR